MPEFYFLGSKHSTVSRDYLSRVNDREYPKHLSAELAKKWDFDYWDGDRRICYGGYYYKPGYWTPIAKSLIAEYSLTNDSLILEVGCGKGFLLYELKLLLPGIRLAGLDISNYALSHSPPEISKNLQIGSATSLPFSDLEFDLAFSINTLHNLYAYELYDALREIKRVSKRSYIVVESYRNEKEKANLLYWQVTCESFYTPKEWLWWFELTGYNQDYEFIYFE